MYCRFIFSAFILMFYGMASAASSLTFIAEELPPYHFKNQQGQVDGALVDIAKAVLKEADLTATFEIMPMARAFHELEKNTNTIMLSLLKSPRRDKRFKWLGAAYFADAYLVSLKNHKDKVTHLNIAKAYKVATIRGYSSEQYLKKAGFREGKNLVLVSYYPQLWQMLYKKRIDFVLTNTLTLENELKRSGLNPNQIAKRVHLTDYPSLLYFAGNKKLDAHTADKITNALNKIKENKQYHAILNKWQLPFPNNIN